MALCPDCGFRFLTLDDEEGMHDCPSCGFSAVFHDPVDEADDDPDDDDPNTEDDDAA